MSFSIYEVLHLVIIAIILGMFIEHQITKPYIVALKDSNDRLKKHIREMF